MYFQLPLPTRPLSQSPEKVVAAMEVVNGVAMIAAAIVSREILVRAVCISVLLLDIGYLLLEGSEGAP
jgi:hypothetical protein